MKHPIHPHLTARCRGFGSILLLMTALVLSGCGTSGEKEQSQEFFTSGSREADQRASQRMAKSEQVKDAGDKKGDKEEQKPQTLYDRLGGEAGIGKIMDDFLARAMQDPRVNWSRKGVTRGGLRLDRNKPVFENQSAANVALLKKHMAQFFALASGGPARYEGKEMGTAHAELKITNAEFDAAVGDLKASLDKFQVGEREQKELLAIVESTRPQVVTVR